MRRKRVNEEAEENAPPKVLRKDHASGPTHSTRGGKSLAAMGLDVGSTFSSPAAQNTPTAVSDLEPLSYAKPQPHPVQDIAQSSKGAAVEIPTEDFATTEVAMGSQLRLRFEQEVRLLKKATAKIARHDQKIQAREEEIKKLDEEIRSLRTLETEAKSVDLAGELESLRAQFYRSPSYQPSIIPTSVQSVSTKMDARLDALSIGFDEELYPHMLTAIADRRWVIRPGLRLAIMKCAESTKLRQAFADVVSARIMKGTSEGLKYGVDHGEAKLDLAAIEAYDPEAEAKYVATLTALRDLKYPLVDQLEKLRDAPIDLLMASLNLESDSREDTPEWIRELRPSTSQLKIPIYLDVRNLRNPWSAQEEMLLEDSIAANRSRAEKKKKCRVVCRTHGVGSVHHARSDGIPVSAPTVAPQGLAILLVDAAVQTEASEDEASPRLLRSKSLPPMYNLDWP
ncbi:hypothetical protein Tco_0857401 [Tanacetum coccineum]|uniref:Transposase (Putative), gypsy type n=1 Tax=Tanacetum coccineum TaxID=301880 RepID=A0ABQ5BBV0_9ASTR